MVKELSISFEQRLNEIVKKYHDLANIISDPEKTTKDNYIKISKEYSQISHAAEKIILYKGMVNEKIALEKELENNQDTNWAEIIKSEIKYLQEKIEEEKNIIQIMLLPEEEDNKRNIILEIRSGTGGEESSLFVADLMKMYTKYAEFNNWKFEIISLSMTEVGGYREVIISISGNSIYEKMKFESGVHRVQRVPKTETAGRIHTSAATVAILPEAEEIDIKIDPNDLRIDVYRSSGNGGQSVNTTDSAVRITHIPTGTVVTQQDEKSQHKNKSKAMKILMARLYAKEQQEKHEKRAINRKSQVGTGDRSERIRTYNFPQGRITDHRISLTSYKMEAILNEGCLDEIIGPLIKWNNENKISDFYGIH